jgi:hypothetical protein
MRSHGLGVTVVSVSVTSDIYLDWNYYSYCFAFRDGSGFFITNGADRFMLGAEVIHS